MPLSFKADSRLLGVYFRNHIFIVHDDLAFPNWSVLIAYALPFLLWQVKDLVRLVLVWYQSLEKSICLVGNPLHVAVHLCMLKAPWNCDTLRDTTHTSRWPTVGRTVRASCPARNVKTKVPVKPPRSRKNSGVSGEVSLLEAVWLW